MPKVSNNFIAALLVAVIIINIVSMASHVTNTGKEKSAGGVTIGMAGLCVFENVSINPIENQTVTAGNPFFLDVNTTPATSSVIFYDTFPIFNITSVEGYINFTPQESDVGIYDEYIKINNSCGAFLDEIPVRFTIMTSNRAPVLDAIPDQTINQNDEFYYDANATDPDADPLTFGDNSTFFNIDPQTGEISFTPIQDDVGNNSVLIYVFDDKNAMDSQVVNFEILDVNDAPVLDPIGSQTAIINKTFFYDVNATDVDVALPNIITYGDNTSLFNIDPVTGIINFTPTDADNGTYWINITATDGYLYDWEVVSFSVTPENRPPNITWWDPKEYELEMYEGDVRVFSIYAVDPDGTVPSAQWYLDGGTLSNAVEYNYSYSPVSGSYGYHNLTVVVSDGELTDYHEWQILVKRKYVPETQTSGSSSTQEIVFKKQLCMENWRCGEWSVCSVEGIQIRRCWDVNKCGTTFYKPETARNCTYYPQPSCEDGILNCHHGGCEILVDCGGPCPPCPTCSDGIQNQGELGIDCGGPCPPCIESREPIEGIEEPKGPYCGDGVCNKGELFTCFEDCGGNFTQLMSVILAIIIILILSYIYNETIIVSIMKFKRTLLLALGKKASPVLTSRERTGTDLLVELSGLKERLNDKNAQEIFETLAMHMKRFFSRSVRLHGEFTYIDLNEAISKAGIKEATKKKISNFAVGMTKLEYSGESIRMADVLNMINLAITIVEEMTKMTLDKALSIHKELSAPPAEKLAEKGEKQEKKEEKGERASPRNIIAGCVEGIRGALKRKAHKEKQEKKEVRPEKPPEKREEKPPEKKKGPLFILEKILGKEEDMPAPSKPPEKKALPEGEKTSQEKKEESAEEKKTEDVSKEEREHAEEPPKYLPEKKPEEKRVLEKKEKPDEKLLEEIPKMDFEEAKMKINNLLDEAERNYRLENYEKAKELYKEAKKYYDMVSKERKKELVKETIRFIRLYNEIIASM